MRKFSELKNELIRKLEIYKETINQASSFMNVEKLLEKIERTIEDLKNEKFKIVIFGSFSDGKTTILSALSSRTDLEISPEPTTDKIKKYKFGDCIIVDTPGLFSENIRHDEISKDFISEADLVIFVTEATNPLKESHHKTIKWLLKDLGKLNQTIFVINKLDKVTALEDKEDFKEACFTRKEVVISTLNKILGIEKKDYLIVCLAADPWEMGMDYWLENKDEYESLSNIKELERMINSIIEKNKYKLMQERVESVIQDVVIRTKSKLETLIEELEEQLEKIDIQREEFQLELDKIKSEVNKVIERMKDKLDSFRESLITSIHFVADEDDFKKIIQKEIGDSCEILKERIEQIYKEEIEPLQEHLRNFQNVLEEISSTYEKINKISLELLKDLELKTINIPKNRMGEIISKSKLLHGLLNKLLKISNPKNKILAPIISITFEILSIVGEIWNKHKLEEKKKELVDNLNCLFSKLNHEIKLELERVISEYEKILKPMSEQYEGYKQSLDRLKKLNALLSGCK